MDICVIRFLLFFNHYKTLSIEIICQIYSLTVFILLINVLKYELGCPKSQILPISQNYGKIIDMFIYAVREKF